MITKCRCQHCNQNIEFDADNIGQMVNCPHCQMETLLYHPTAPAREKRKTGNMLWVIAGIVTLLLIGFMIWRGLSVAGEVMDGAGATTAGVLGGVVSLAVLAIGCVLVVFWVVFPIMVYAQLKRIEKAIRETH